METPPTDARRVGVDAARLARWLDGFAQRHGAVQCETEADVVLFSAADGSKAWVDVPFPPVRGELVEHVERERRIGVLLVRRGGYAAGVFQGRTLVSSKVGTAYVQGTTKAGGWSQQRYARRRANQSHAAFAEAADTAVRIFGPETQLDALVCGGDRAAIDEVLADPRLAAPAALRTGVLLAGPDPRLRVLQATPEEFLKVQITLVP